MNEAASIDFAVPERVAHIRVELGPRGYDIVIGAGLLDSIEALTVLYPKLRRVLIVTDETVEGLHGPRLRAPLGRIGIACETVVLPPGEGTKSFATLQSLCETLLAKRIERSDVVVAFGGGVIGDIAGFAASILLRGIDYVQVPTTLLAQVDSSVGGKTAIDTPQGKNLVGAFHQPRLVIADTALLDTLSRRDRLAGYAEVAKYGLVGNAPFFAWLERAWERIIDHAGPERAGAINHSCQAKARIVAADEREAGERALLNFGHTFAHALEAEARYEGVLLHVEAVTVGMALAFELSAALGLCPAEDARRVRRHLSATGLPDGLAALSSSFDADALIAHMAKDKKVRDGRMTFVLARGIGDVFLCADVDAGSVRALLRGAAA